MNRLRSFFSYSAIFIVLLVPTLVLIGWFIDNIILTRVLPQFTPMNPMTAVSFLLVGFYILLEYRGKHVHIQRGMATIVSAWLFIIGGVMLVKYVFGFDIFIDRILFESKLGINRMAPVTSLNLVLLSFIVFFYPKKRRYMRFVELLVMVISIYSLLAYLYNFAGIYGVAIYNPIAIHTAFLFLICSLYFFIRGGLWDGQITETLRRKKVLTPIILSSIFVTSMILVLGICLLLTSYSYRQSALKFQNQSNQITTFIQSRLSLYIDVTRGLQGLYAASDDVKNSEWSAYINALDVPTNYSGVSSLLYAPKVSKEELASSSQYIFPQTDKAFYFPLTYVVTFTNSTSSSIGFDISSETERNKALTKAILTNTPVATPVVEAAVTKTPVFSLYVPVYKNGVSHESDDQKTENTKGIIAVVFRTEHIFPDLVKSPLFDEFINVQISDKASLLYDSESASVNKSKADLVQISSLPFGGRLWTISFYAHSGNNLPWVQRFAALIAFVLGLAFSLLVTMLAASYIRSREKALQSKNIQLETLIHNFPYGVLIEDENRKAVLANSKLAEVFGLNTSINEIIGKDTRDLVAATQSLIQNFKVYFDRIEEIIKKQKVVADESIELSNGKYISRSYVPLYYSDEFHGGVWIYKDVSEEKKIDQAKTEFVSLASHQLRTPLTAIKWYAELLNDKSAGALNNEQQEYVHEVEEATIRMVDLVNSLLNVSRLELGTFAIEPENADIIAVLQEAVHEQEPTFKLKKQTFIFTHPDFAPSIIIDKKITHILIQNLLSNAHKYTQEEGKIELSLEIIGKDSSDGYAQIICSDNGYGIPKAQQQSVFKKLFRADNIRTLDVEGTGLGLYIIKTVVEAAGCSITFSSEENKGTSFILKIPLSGMVSKKGDRPLSLNSSEDDKLKKS